ncbi:unnamed protein product, partial [Discosporangium mesarthrocarpum]
MGTALSPFVKWSSFRLGCGVGFRASLGTAKGGVICSRHCTSPV